MPDDRCLFERDGERLVPSGLARGPWYPGTQHGSAMLGIVARAVERLPAPRPVQVTRLSVDMMRAAPLAPVETRARVVRGGRSVDFVEAEIVAAGEVCVRATAMRTRLAGIDVPEAIDGMPVPRPPPLPADGGEWPRFRSAEEEALHHALDIRPVPGFETATAWFRLTLPLVRGEENSPLVRVAVLSDWTYSVAVVHRLRTGRRELLRRPFVSINPDTTVNLHRPQEGEWLCIDTRTHMAPLGAATAMGQLYDARGPIGFTSQSLLVRGPEAVPEGWGRLDDGVRG